jgi:hypothetical protein
MCLTLLRKFMLYGRFMGAWDGTMRVHRRNGTPREESCEVYFGWVLEGGAIQDVWIAPARRYRAAADRLSDREVHGKTTRVYIRVRAPGRPPGSTQTLAPTPE